VAAAALLHGGEAERSLELRSSFELCVPPAALGLQHVRTGGLAPQGQSVAAHLNRHGVNLSRALARAERVRDVACGSRRRWSATPDDAVEPRVEVRRWGEVDGVPVQLATLTAGRVRAEVSGFGATL